MFRFAAASSKPSTLAQTVIRLGAVAAACSALTWSLSGCGGGSRAKDYTPDSVVSFGDENSAMETFESTNMDPNGSATKTVEGLIYTVNPVVFGADLLAYTYCTNPTGTALCVASATDTDPNYLVTGVTGFTATASHPYYFASKNTEGTNILTMVSTGTGTYNSGTPALKQTYDIVYKCESSFLWNQAVAHNFGKGFLSKCSRDLAGAETYAALGAKVSDLQTQVSDHRSELRDGVLVTIMIGQNDIKEIYDRVQGTATPALSDSQALSELASRGATAAEIVKSVLSTGAKVVLALTPDLGQSPLATKPGENASLLAAYTKKFNDALKFGMGSTAAQDGRHFALVESDLFTNPITRSTAYVHSTAVCADAATFTKPDGSTVTGSDPQALRYCTGKTLVTNGSTSTYIWADDLHYAPAGHGLIGSTAATRVYNQF